MSWKPEQKVGGVWYPNAVAFATKEEAELNARRKWSAWTMSEDWRAVESDETPNYRETDTGLEALPNPFSPTDEGTAPGIK